MSFKPPTTFSIRACQGSSGGYTPSDFDKVDLEQQDLDELATILDEIDGLDGLDDF